jgi:hypothetical protein
MQRINNYIDEYALWVWNSCESTPSLRKFRAIAMNDEDDVYELDELRRFSLWITGAYDSPAKCNHVDELLTFTETCDALDYIACMDCIDNIVGYSPMCILDKVAYLCIRNMSDDKLRELFGNPSNIPEA